MNTLVVVSKFIRKLSQGVKSSHQMGRNKHSNHEAPENAFLERLRDGCTACYALLLMVFYWFYAVLRRHF